MIGIVSVREIEMMRDRGEAEFSSRLTMRWLILLNEVRRPPLVSLIQEIDGGLYANLSKAILVLILYALFL